MKNIYLLFVLLFFVQISLHAQNFIPFQGIAMDGSGKALASKKIGIKISILKDNASGTVSYSESHAPTTDNNGLFQINIGSGTALTNTFAAIDWSTLNYFLKLEMDVNGGTSYSLISTTQMGFVPFAFYAKNGGTTSNVTGSGVTVDNKGNTAAGGAKFSSITTGFGNFIFSNNSMAKATTGADNVAIGSGVLLENVSGWANNALGRDALKSNTSGDSNSAFGSYSLLNNISGRANSSFGNESLRENSTGNYNAGFGNGSLWKNTIGSFNTATGYNALNSNTIGLNNTGLGYQAMLNNSEGSFNTVVGSLALLNNLNGRNNTSFGFSSLKNNAGDGISTGENNTAIGYNAGAINISGSNNTYLGNNANPISANLHDVTVLGSSAKVSSSFTMALGDADTNKWVFGISTTTNPGYAFQVGSSTSNGNGAFLTNGGTWTNASSRVFKENFEDLSNTEILSKVSKLNIQKWKYKGTDETHIGPIAEEFKDIFEVGVVGDRGHISTIDASGVALKAIQALMEEVRVLKEKIIELEKKN